MGNSSVILHNFILLTTISILNKGLFQSQTVVNEQGDSIKVKSKEASSEGCNRCVEEAKVGNSDDLHFDQNVQQNPEEACLSSKGKRKSQILRFFKSQKPDLPTTPQNLDESGTSQLISDDNLPVTGPNLRKMQQVSNLEPVDVLHFEKTSNQEKVDAYQQEVLTSRISPRAKTLVKLGNGSINLDHKKRRAIPEQVVLPTSKARNTPKQKVPDNLIPTTIANEFNSTAKKHAANAIPLRNSVTLNRIKINSQATSSSASPYNSTRTRTSDSGARHYTNSAISSNLGSPLQGEEQKKKLIVRGLKKYKESRRLSCPPLWVREFPCKSKFHVDDYIYDFDEGPKAVKRNTAIMSKCPKQGGRCNKCGIYAADICLHCRKCETDCQCSNNQNQLRGKRNFNQFAYNNYGNSRGDPTEALNTILTTADKILNEVKSQELPNQYPFNTGANANNDSKPDQFPSIPGEFPLPPPPPPMSQMVYPGSALPIHYQPPFYPGYYPPMPVPMAPMSFGGVHYGYPLPAVPAPYSYQPPPTAAPLPYSQQRFGDFNHDAYQMPQRPLPSYRQYVQPNLYNNPCARN